MPFILILLIFYVQRRSSSSALICPAPSVNLALLSQQVATPPRLTGLAHSKPQGVECRVARVGV